MPLARRNIPIVLDGGLDQKVAIPHVQPGSVLGIENGLQIKTGEIRKRFGVTARAKGILGGGSVANGVGLATVGDRMFLRGRHGVNYEWSVDQAKWVLRDTAPVFRSRYEHIGSDPTKQYFRPSSAYGSGLLLTAWAKADDGASEVALNPGMYSVVDVNTGAVLVPPTQFDDEVHGIHVVYSAIAGAFYICYSHYVGSGTSRILLRKVSASTPTTLGSETVIVSDAQVVTGMNEMDAAVDTSTGHVFVVYQHENFSSRAHLGVARYNVSTDTTDVTGDYEDTSGAGMITGAAILRHDWSDSTLHVAFSESSGTDTVSVIGFSTSTLAVTAGPSVVESNVTSGRLTGYYDGSKAVVIYQIDGATSFNDLVKKGDTSSNSVLARGCTLHSKSFRYGAGGKECFVVAYSGTNERTYFAIDEDGTIVGKAAYREGGSVAAGPNVADVATVSDTHKIVPILRTVELRASNGVFFTVRGVGLYHLHIADSATYDPRIGHAVEMGGSHQPGAVMRTLDGNVAVETGYHHAPEPATLAEASGGILDATNTYGYKLVFSWRDSLGTLWRSEPSAAATITLTGTNRTVNLTIPTYRLTRRRAHPTGGASYPAAANVRIEIYRTEGNDTVYFKDGEISNDPTVDTVSFASSQSDDDLGQILYTEGGQLPFRAPPPCAFASKHRNRVFVVSADDPRELWPSMEQVKGEGVAFHDDLKVRFDEEITALGSLDDKLIAWTRNDTYVVLGEGPNGLGQNKYPPPERVVTSVGCIEPNVIARMPEALLFESPKGIYAIGRGLQAGYIGANVEDKVSELTITAALTVDDKNQIRFFSSNGTTLVYDWFFKRWDTFTGQSAVHAIPWMDQVTYLESDGDVQVEVDGQFDDNGTAIVTKLDTSWMSASGLQGHFRIYELAALGQFRGDHKLRVTFFFDWSEDAAESQPFVRDMTGEAAGNVVRLRACPGRQRCESVRVRIEDVLSSASEGWRLWALTYDVGAKPGIAWQGAKHAQSDRGT